MGKPGSNFIVLYTGILYMIARLTIANKTYDLLQFSTVQITKETDEANSITIRDKCSLQTGRLNNPKMCLENPSTSWISPFDEYTKEMKIKVTFSNDYAVNSFILSFKEASNISAIFVEFILNGRHVKQVSFARSKILCDFYFPSRFVSKNCTVKEDLYNGTVKMFQEPILASSVMFHFFPPVTDTSSEKSFYAINQLYIGGRCHCLSKTNRECIVVGNKGDDAKPSALLCPQDENYYLYHHFYSRRRRDVTNECKCSRYGTQAGFCNPFTILDYACPCKSNYGGSFCDQCAPGYFNFPKCTACQCNGLDFMKQSCDQKTGDCFCDKKYSGRQCEKCAIGYFDFPFCYPCSCSKSLTQTSICDAVTGDCHCLDKYTGKQCTACKPMLKNFPLCQPISCQCSSIGSKSQLCNEDGSCTCKDVFEGKYCDRCKQGFTNFPYCSACQCNNVGSLSDDCDITSGDCVCKHGFAGKFCNQCATKDFTFPNCRKSNKICKCNKLGTWFSANTTGQCVEKVSCLCKKNVEGVDCSRCKQNYYNLSAINYATGCLSCQCSPEGTISQVRSCGQNNGQCICKENVAGRTCNKCKSGYHLLSPWNPFGCTACGCNAGGSLSNSCNDYGMCKCIDNIVGLKCDKMKDGNFYVPSFYHNIYEAEHGYHMNKTHHVELEYDNMKFQNFSGRGFVSFSKTQPELKLDIFVRKASQYQILLRYSWQDEKEISMVIKLTSPDGNISYPAVATFNYGTQSDVLAVGRSQEKEFFLTKGVWMMEMSTIAASLYLDYVVLLPQDYYTADSLTCPSAKPCSVKDNDAKLCLMYRYIQLSKFITVQAEDGTNSKGYGNELVSKTNFYKDREILKRLPILQNMAELSRKQIALTMQVRVDATDDYVIVITYFNPNERTQRINVFQGSRGSRGYMDAVPCFYRFMCRSVVINDRGNVLVMKLFRGALSDITLLGNIVGTIGIDYLTLIPVKKWNFDYLRLYERCHLKNGFCQHNYEFPKSSEMIALQPNQVNPVNQFTKSVYADSGKTVYFDILVSKNESYNLIYQYFQPHSPSFHVKMEILKETGHLVASTEILVNHCTAKIGCRSVYKNLILAKNALVSFTIPVGKAIWMDSVFLIQSSSFEESLMKAKRTEMSSKFKRSCLNKNGLPFEIPPDGFCRQALFTLTTKYLGKVFECECNKQGSVSSKCDRIGGKCKCRQGVTGRKCDQCQTGYYGFPYCRPCGCSQEGSISPDCSRYGECKCRLLHSGKICDRCVKGSWGYPNCRECACDRRGSFTLTCRLSDGQCPCLGNYAGRQCNECQVGYFNFPTCQNCNCNSAGIRITSKAPTGCYLDNPNRCDCKRYVTGSQCDTCKDGYHGLILSNPYGCTYCNCSKFGTIPGEDSCNKRTGQCSCLPHVTGRQCHTCADGFRHNNVGKIFKCKACDCNPGGSYDNKCNKETGQCNCKPYITGIKCDNYIGNFHLPSFGEIVFEASDLVPFSKRKYLKNFHGNFVNSSFASTKYNFNVLFEQSYFVAISYSLVEEKKVKISLEFSHKDSTEIINHTFRSKKLQKSRVDMLKTRLGLTKIDLKSGQHNLQLVFFGEVLLDRISLIPVSRILSHNLKNYSMPACTIDTDDNTICDMHSYYGYSKHAVIRLQFEDYISGIRNTPSKSIGYEHAAVKKAIYVNFIRFEKTFNTEQDYYVVVQYMSFDTRRSSYQFISHSFDDDYQLGIVHFEPCQYTFGCRRVVLSYRHDGKKQFSRGNGERIFTFQLTRGAAVYFDYMLIIPMMHWNVHYISPAFYCQRRSIMCLNGTFGVSPNSLVLLTKKARGMQLLSQNPPGVYPPVESIRVSNSQRDLRWLHSLNRGGFYIVLHYYQALSERFASKIIVTTHQRALAGKVMFAYCPSKYGCRSVVTYLEDDYKQRFLISGNILRLTFTIPSRRQVWIDSVMLIPINEYPSDQQLLQIKPLTYSKRFLRKCLGQKFDYVDEAHKNFCKSALFRFHLYERNSQLVPCNCNLIGSNTTTCNFYDGSCSCKLGFTGVDCSTELRSNIKL